MSGVRSSWLTLLKKAVLARSSSARLSARFRFFFVGLGVGDAGGDLAGDRSRNSAIDKNRNRGKD